MKQNANCTMKLKILKNKFIQENNVDYSYVFMLFLSC